MGRAPCCDKASVKKGPWSPEEDRKLKEFIDKNGTGGNWIALPHKAGLKRCGKSCRLRWLNYLRPNIKHGDFSDEEDRVICNLFATIGSRWSIIAGHLPGRTDNDIKNYWNTKLKKKLMAAGAGNGPAHHRKSSSANAVHHPHHFIPALPPAPATTPAMSTSLFSFPTHHQSIVDIPHLFAPAMPPAMYGGAQCKAETGSMLAFGGGGGADCCSSSEITQFSYIDGGNAGGGGEQVAFDSYLFGSEAAAAAAALEYSFDAGVAPAASGGGGQIFFGDLEPMVSGGGGKSCRFLY